MALCGAWWSRLQCHCRQQQSAKVFGLGAKLQQKAIVTFKALRNGLPANCASAIAATREAATLGEHKRCRALAATRDSETPTQPRVAGHELPFIYDEDWLQ